MGNDASRWQSALQRNLECPQGGEASGRPVCLLEEVLALLQLQWRQEAIPVHLLPPGWWAVAQGALLLSVPPCSVGGLWLEGSPLPLAGSMAFRPFPAELPSFKVAL